MNKKTAKKLREQARQAATNCIPANYKTDPNQRRRFELHTANATYVALKKMGGMERSKLTQIAIDKIAHEIAMPSTRKKKEKKSKLTKNQAKAARRARG